MPISDSTIEGAFVAMVTGDSTVAGIIGANAMKPFTDTTAVARPKLSYWRWGTDRSAPTGGFTNDGPTGMAIAKFLVDAWADDLLTVKQLVNAVRNAVNGKGGTFNGLKIDVIQVVDEREQPAQRIAGREKPVQRVTLDLRLTYGDIQ